MEDICKIHYLTESYNNNQRYLKCTDRVMDFKRLYSLITCIRWYILNITYFEIHKTTNKGKDMIIEVVANAV